MDQSSIVRHHHSHEHDLNKEQAVPYIGKARAAVVGAAVGEVVSQET